MPRLRLCAPFEDEPSRPIELALIPPHTSEHTCPRPRKFDNSGCICDLRKWAHTNSDWPIARVVGSATYAQLCDSSPGLYESFPDFRSNGYAASSNAAISNSDATGAFRIKAKLTKEDEAPPPPNSVSVYLAEGVVSPADLKRKLIIEAASKIPKPGFSTVFSNPNGRDAADEDPIEPAGWAARELLGTSRIYRNPELNVGEVTTFFVIMALVVSVFLAAGMSIYADCMYP